MLNYIFLVEIFYKSKLKSIRDFGHALGYCWKAFDE
jgi:hypothetical protein